MRVREIRCNCGAKLGQVRKPVEGRVSWEHKCRACRRLVEITLTAGGTDVRYLDPEPPRATRPIYVQ